MGQQQGAGGMDPSALGIGGLLPQLGLNTGGGSREPESAESWPQQQGLSAGYVPFCDYGHKNWS